MPDRQPPPGIDPRGPRFAASLTALLLAIDVVLALTGISTQRGVGGFAYQPLADQTFIPDSGWAIMSASVGQRAFDPGFLLLLVIALLFLWGVLSPRTAPWGIVFRRGIRPRLQAPTDLEDPRPPRFAQGVGLCVTAIGLALHLAGVPWGLPIAAALAFIAAFLNAVFGLCLGCRLYLLLQRVGLVGCERSAA